MLFPTAVVELVWQDASGSTSATTVCVNPASTYAQIDASATALASILASITGAVLVKQRIKFKAVPEAPVSASGGTPILRTGVFFFTIGTDEAMALIVVHAVKDAIIVSSGPGAGVMIDESNSDVISFINAVTDNNVSNPFAGDVTGFDTAYLQSRV